MVTPPREETTILTTPSEIEPTTKEPKKKDDKGIWCYDIILAFIYYRRSYKFYFKHSLRCN